MRAKAGFITLGPLAILVCFVLPHTRAQPLQIERFRDVLEAQDSDHKALPLEDDSPIHNDDGPPWAKEKQRKALLQANLTKAKKDAAELAGLAQEVRGILEKPNIVDKPNLPAIPQECVMKSVPAIPQECVVKLDRIDKLARKIRAELRAY